MYFAGHAPEHDVGRGFEIFAAVCFLHQIGGRLHAINVGASLRVALKVPRELFENVVYAVRAERHYHFRACLRKTSFFSGERLVVSCRIRWLCILVASRDPNEGRFLHCNCLPKSYTSCRPVIPKCYNNHNKAKNV